jgi:hypothetical protein
VNALVIRQPAAAAQLMAHAFARKFQGMQGCTVSVT